MEKFISVYGGMMGFRPFNSRQLQESSQVNHQQVPVPTSYHNSLSNREKVSKVFYPGIGSNQSVIPPAPSFDGKKNDNSNYFVANSKWSNGQGDLNRISEDGTEKYQPVPLFDGKKDSSNYFFENSQRSNCRGDLSRASEGGTKTKQVCQRLKWTDEMVKVLITAVSYVEEDAILPEGHKNEMNMSLPPIKGKWKAISKAMAEKGFFVSHQQCEDKFNDLNKRFKRLNDILGKGTTSEIVQNPTLLQFVNINEETKVEVMKLLGYKQLFYQEMCSFHNKNKFFLPHDELLQKSVQSSLKRKVKYGSKNLALPMPAKRQKQGEDIGVSGKFDNYLPTNAVAELTILPFGAVKGVQDLDQWMISRSLELEEKSLLIKNQLLELEKNKNEWLKLLEKEDMELHKMKVENESLKLENARLANMLECRKQAYYDSKSLILKLKKPGIKL